MKAIYIRGTGDPHQLADLVLSHIGHCLTLLEEHSVESLLRRNDLYLTEALMTDEDCNVRGS